MNQVALKLSKHFEGYRTGPYLCPAGIPTSGYGHAWYPPEKPIPLSHQEAEAYLSNDLAKAERAVYRICPGMLLESKERQGAIIDFVFNLGAGRLQASTLRRRIQQRNWPEVQYELRRWIRGGGKILPGLVLRREAEAKLV